MAWSSSRRLVMTSRRLSSIRRTDLDTALAGRGGDGRGCGLSTPLSRAPLQSRDMSIHHRRRALQQPGDRLAVDLGRFGWLGQEPFGLAHRREHDHLVLVRPDRRVPQACGYVETSRRRSCAQWPVCKGNWLPYRGIGVPTTLKRSVRTPPAPHRGPDQCRQSVVARTEMCAVASECRRLRNHPAQPFGVSRSCSPTSRSPPRGYQITIGVELDRRPQGFGLTVVVADRHAWWCYPTDKYAASGPDSPGPTIHNRTNDRRHDPDYGHQDRSKCHQLLRPGYQAPPTPSLGTQAITRGPPGASLRSRSSRTLQARRGRSMCLRPSHGTSRSGPRRSSARSVMPMRLVASGS